MKKYFIESFKIDKLWGDLDMNLIFEPDVNILIGPNGSGKTTVLNLLHSILSADLRSILDINFDQAVIKLKSFDEKSVRTVKVKVADGFLNLSVAQNKFTIDIDIISGRRARQLIRFDDRSNVIRRILPKKLYDELTGLVPIVWLPVSRYLPVTEDEKERYTGTDSVESVNLRLRKLLERLSRYHSSLNALLSERYKKFEHQVLSEMLYRKDHGQLELFPPASPTQEEKEQLLGAFEVAGLLDEEMESRIDEHFAVAEEVWERIGKSKKADFDWEDALVLSLVHRTRAMVEYAGALERDRERIFASLRRYEAIVNSFFWDEKSVRIDESGELKIESSSPSDLNPYLLSSGEKQILILLTEALLKVDEPVVYMTDEPELSLHILWQEKILESLVTLSGQIQIIVATHSPDIVGRYRDKVIDLGRES